MAGVCGVLNASAVGIAGAATIIALRWIGIPRLQPEQWLAPIHPALLLAALVLAGRLLLQVWFFAPYTSDVASYHLPKIAEWIRAGSFTREMGLDSHVTFPAGFELVETWWVMFLHHDVLIEMAGVEFLAISFLATYVLAKAAGLTASGAFLGSIIYILTPGVHLQATSCLNDGPVASLVLATAALLVSQVPVGLVVLVAGLGLGVKPIYGFALPGMLYLALPFAKSNELWKRVTPAGFVALGGGILLGSFWYLRNWLWFGNPFYPLGSKGILEVTGQPTIQAGPRLVSIADNLSHLVDSRILDADAPWGALMTQISGWGPAAVACGMIALPIVLSRSTVLRRLAVGLFLSLLSVFALALPDAWSMRFVLFFPCLLAVATACYSELHKGILLAVVPALALQFVGTMIPAELPGVRCRSLAAQSWRDRSAGSFFDADAPGHKVAYFADHFGEVYFLYRPDYSRQVLYLRSKSLEELLSDLSRAGAALLYAVPTSPRTAKILEEGIRAGRLQPITDRFFAVR